MRRVHKHLYWSWYNSLRFQNMGDNNMTKTAYIDFKAVKAAVDFRTVLSHYGIEPKGRGDQLKILWTDSSLLRLKLDK